ncbi:MAG TPA: acyltransferase [Intrasporangium sp.]|uniref:acyltransferase family protein n=1 Tax=Intrasporangium sp. TaxID=1925024 RepID=UPI002F94DE33
MPAADPSQPSTPDSSTAGTPIVTPRRISALDGLRGLAVVLVALGHAGGLLWPRQPLDSVPVLRGFFGGGAVEIFFIVGGLIVTRGLLREHQLGVLDPVRFYLRRLVRLGVQLVPLVLVIVLIHHVDPMDPWTDRGTYLTAAHTLTHTSNVWAASHLLEVRSDLGHLWYLSVQQQVYIVLPLVILLLARRQRALAGLLAAGIVAVTIWRYHVLEHEGWLIATTSTLTRADGVLFGALIAVTLLWWRRWSRFAGTLMAVTAVGLLVLMASLHELPELVFLREWGIAFNVTASALVLGIYLARQSTAVGRVLSLPLLTYLGRASLAIFVWHLPIFTVVARHTGDWDWFTRTVLGVAILAAVVVVTHRWVEEPARRWLATHLRAPEPPTEPTTAPPHRPEAATLGGWR